MAVAATAVALLIVGGQMVLIGGVGESGSRTAAAMAAVLLVVGGLSVLIGGVGESRPRGSVRLDRGQQRRGR